MTGQALGSTENTLVCFDNGDNTILNVSAGNPLPVDATLVGDVTIGNIAKANAADPSLAEAGSYPVSVDLSGHQRVLDSAVVAKLPTVGTAGTPSSNVISVQGVASGTVLPVQTSFLFQNITTSTTTTVKSGAGVLRGVTVNTKGTIASTITIYDNTAGSGTKIGVIDSLNLAGQFEYDIAFATGLTLVTTGTAAPDITVAYR